MGLDRLDGGRGALGETLGTPMGLPLLIHCQHLPTVLTRINSPTDLYSDPTSNPCVSVLKGSVGPVAPHSRLCQSLSKVTPFSSGHRAPPLPLFPVLPLALVMSEVGLVSSASVVPT